MTGKVVTTELQYGDYYKLKEIKNMLKESNLFKDLGANYGGIRYIVIDSIYEMSITPSGDFGGFKLIGTKRLIPVERLLLEEVTPKNLKKFIMFNMDFFKKKPKS